MFSTIQSETTDPTASVQRIHGNQAHLDDVMSACRIRTIRKYRTFEVAISLTPGTNVTRGGFVLELGYLLAIVCVAVGVTTTSLVWPLMIAAGLAAFAAFVWVTK